MITDADRTALADLAMRALDSIDEYGDDAELIAATLVYEIRVPDEEEPETGPLYHGNYKSLHSTSPHHSAGLLQATAQHILR